MATTLNSDTAPATASTPSTAASSSFNEGSSRGRSCHWSAASELDCERIERSTWSYSLSDRPLREARSPSVLIRTPTVRATPATTASVVSPNRTFVPAMLRRL